VSAQSAVDEVDRAKVRKSCELDLREFDATYYGERIPSPPMPVATTAATAGAGENADDPEADGPASFIYGRGWRVPMDFARGI